MAKIELTFCKRYGHVKCLALEKDHYICARCGIPMGVVETKP